MIFLISAETNTDGIFGASCPAFGYSRYIASFITSFGGFRYFLSLKECDANKSGSINIMLTD